LKTKIISIEKEKITETLYLSFMINLKRINEKKVRHINAINGFKITNMGYS